MVSNVNIVRSLRRPMRGLVLEGGGLRGLFTAGVLDVWMENDVAFDAIIGVSAGACFGCNYKSRQPGRVIRYNVRFARDPRYCGIGSLLRTGDLFGAEFCYHTLPETLDPFDGAAFEANPPLFYISATDVKDGSPVYRRLDRADRAAFDWIRASASMPLVSRPVPVEGGLYLDGGLSDGLPIQYFESIGYERNVVVTTRPRGYRKRPAKGLWLLRPFLRRHPAVIRALATRHLRYNATLDHLAEREKAGMALVVAPPAALAIGRVCHDPDEMRRAYDIGREVGLEVLPRVRAF